MGKKIKATFNAASNIGLWVGGVSAFFTSPWYWANMQIAEPLGMAGTEILSGATCGLLMAGAAYSLMQKDRSFVSHAFSIAALGTGAVGILATLGGTGDLGIMSAQYLALLSIPVTSALNLFSDEKAEKAATVKPEKSTPAPEEPKP